MKRVFVVLALALSFLIQSVTLWPLAIFWWIWFIDWQDPQRWFWVSFGLGLFQDLAWGGPLGESSVIFILSVAGFGWVLNWINVRSRWGVIGLTVVIGTTFYLVDGRFDIGWIPAMVVFGLLRRRVYV